MLGSRSKRTRQDCYYALCTACSNTLPSGSTYPHCQDCIQTTVPEPQEAPANASVSNATPEWVTQMSQSMTQSIDNLTSTLLQALQCHVSSMNATQQRECSTQAHDDPCTSTSRSGCKRTHRSRSSASSHSTRSSPSRERHRSSRSSRPSPTRDRQCSSPQRSPTREGLHPGSPSRRRLSDTQDSEGICDSDSDKETEGSLIPIPHSNTALVEDVISSIHRVLDIYDPPPEAPQHKISFEGLLKPPKVFFDHPEFKSILKKQFSQPEKFTNRKYLEARYPFPQETTKE